MMQTKYSNRLVAVTLTLSYLFPLLLQAVQVDGVTLEKEEVLNGVTVSTAKVDSTRILHGHAKIELDADFESVKKSVINFDEKCNNEHRSKRKFIDVAKDCKYLNRNLVESVIVKKTLYHGEKEPNEVERYIVTRYAQNRGSFVHHDLMIAYETLNAAQEKVYEIKHRMLTDAEAAKYLKDPVARESAFQEAYGSFKITAKGLKKTEFEYTYVAKTTHWLINKDVMLGQIFGNVSLGIADLLESVKKGSATSEKITAI